MEIPSALLPRAAVPYGPISFSARLVGKLDILRLVPDNRNEPTQTRGREDDGE